MRVLYFFLVCSHSRLINGKLSENWSEDPTAGYIYISDKDGYKIWQRNEKGNFLFPASWNALLGIQNHTNYYIKNLTLTYL